MAERARRAGQAVKSYRLAKGISQSEFALLAEVGPSLINQIEVHGYVPKLTLQKRIARTMGCRRRDLWPDEDDELATIAQ